MKKKILLTLICCGLFYTPCWATNTSDTKELESALAFKDEKSLWDYLESTYPIVTQDDIDSGQYTGQYVIIDSYAKEVDIQESLEYITCDMYFLQSDGSYKKTSLWACFYGDEDLREHGFISGKEYLIGMQDGDTLRGCYKINSDNSFGPMGMLAIKKTDADTSDISTIETIHLDFSSSVPNDVTGKWRLATVNTDTPVENYLLSYYDNYFKSDDEIHAIINTYDNTTTSVSVLAGMFSVTVHKYVAGEENDAKILFSGDVISDEFYSMETGEIINF